MALDAWKVNAQQRLRYSADWLRRATPGMAYGALATCTLLPLVAAYQQFDAAAFTAIGEIFGGIGLNLFSQQVGAWLSKNDDEVAELLGTKVAEDPAWRDAIDELLQRVDASKVVQAVRPEADFFRALLVPSAPAWECGSPLGADAPRPCPYEAPKPFITQLFALRQILARKVHDQGLLRLIDHILAGSSGVHGEHDAMAYFAGDDRFATGALRTRTRGLPIGNLTSQFWANCYLNPIDHFVKRGLCCTGYVRYVDDLLLFGDDKAQLWQWKGALEARLTTLRLTIHPGAQPRPVAEGIPFLDFTLYPERRRLKRRKGLYFQRKFQRLLWERRAGRQLPAQPNTVDLRAVVLGWVNHVRFANTVGLRKAILTRPS